MHPGHVSSVGVPNSLKILSNWSYVSRIPGNVGIPVTISTNIQPTPHISSDVEYSVLPSRTSNEKKQENFKQIDTSDDYKKITFIRFFLNYEKFYKIHQFDELRQYIIS